MSCDNHLRSVEFALHFRLVLWVALRLAPRFSDFLEGGISLQMPDSKCYDKWRGRLTNTNYRNKIKNSICSTSVNNFKSYSGLLLVTPRFAAFSGHSIYSSTKSPQSSKLYIFCFPTTFDKIS